MRSRTGGRPAKRRSAGAPGPGRTTGQTRTVVDVEHLGHPPGAARVAGATTGVRPAPVLGAGIVLPVGRRSLVLVLRAVVGLLIAGTFVAQVMKWRGIGLGVARFVDADVKVNLPTGYKVFAFAAAALLAAAIGEAARVAADPWARRWTHLALVLGFLMFDEMAYVHQSLASFLGEGDGILHFSWVLVYLPAAVLTALWFLPFVRSLAAPLRNRILLAGLLVGGGSGGVELVKSKIADTSGAETLAFYLTTAVSDSATMIGLAVLIVALFTELMGRTASVELRLGR